MVDRVLVLLGTSERPAQIREAVQVSDDLGVIEIERDRKPFRPANHSAREIEQGGDARRTGL